MYKYDGGVRNGGAGVVYSPDSLCPLSSPNWSTRGTNYINLFDVLGITTQPYQGEPEQGP
jgi:hypothetical protein